MNSARLFVVIGIVLASCNTAWSQSLINNYSKIYIKPGALVVVRTNSVNNSGLLDNAGELTIERDFINNDTATAGGTAGIYNVQRHWINNSVFIANQGKVSLYGDTQLITGNAVTVFYDLELKGTGIKRQTLNSETGHLLALNDRELSTDSFEMLVSNADTLAITRSSGFVSSLATGRLSRNTNSNAEYLFPTGSSLGTVRYRPVMITPASANANTFGGRLANTDASAEGYNRNIKDSAVCEVNPLFYHRIYRTQGTDSADITLNYLPATDGNWLDAAHWQNLPQWELAHAAASANVLFAAYTLSGWNDFAYAPFALAREGPLLALTATDATCNGADDGAITSTVTGGSLPYHYIWNSGDTTASLHLIAGGTYYLTMTDGGGCRSIQSAVVSEPDILSANTSITNPSCPTDTFGAIKLNPAGGTAPYQVIWNNGDTTLSIKDLNLGAYVFTLTDNNGCVHTDSVELLAQSVFFVEMDATSASCTGIANGNASAHLISGTTPPYSYLWNTGDTAATLSNVPPGNYSVTVYDALLCYQYDTVIVGANGLTIDAAVHDAGCPSVADGSVQASASGGTPPYAFAWNSGGSSATLSNIYAGTYSLTVTDQNDCAGTDTFIVAADSTSPCDSLAIYDVFSPNADGANDSWIIDGLFPAYAGNELQVFNRWGNVVYEAKPYDNSWDGRSKNDEPLPVATYYYILKLNDTKARVYSGNVTIVR